jgi:hypothetical protein
MRDSYEEALEFATQGDVPAHGGAGTRYGRVIGDRVAKYELLGNAKSIMPRFEQYIDAGARHIICEWRCRWDEIPWHMEAVARDSYPTDIPSG